MARILKIRDITTGEWIPVPALKGDRGDSGVYTGVGDPPTDTNLWINPEEEPYAGIVLPYSSQTEFPAVGNVHCLYISRETHTLYIWSGSQYDSISELSVQDILDAHTSQLADTASTFAAITSGGVVSGGVVSAQGTPDQTIAVSACVVITDEGKRFSVAADAAFSMPAANGAANRYDIVYINSSGVLAYWTGTAGTNPSIPDTPTHGVILGAVYRPTSDNTIASEDLVDCRTYVPDTNELAYGTREIECFGDSLTVYGGWRDMLADKTGRTVKNAGVEGETAVSIMVRQGADIMIVNDITIPATTTAVTLSDDNGIGTELGGLARLIFPSNYTVNPVSIAGIVGSLHIDASQWKFTRTTAGSEVVITRPTPIMLSYYKTTRNPYLQIIFMGQNGGYADVSDLVKKHQLMVASTKAKHVVILGFSSGTAKSREDYEAAMQTAFGRYFISLRQYLAGAIYTGETITNCYGLDDQGLTPDATDLVEIALGKVPHSCLIDTVHYTTGTNTVIGNYLYQKLCDLGIF